MSDAHRQQREAAFGQLRSEGRDALARALGPARRVALIGFPWHLNIGDSLIVLGSMALLDELNVELGYVADGGTYDPRALRRAVPDGPILLAGGGNFGDRYHHHQLLRERVILDFPDRRIISLPQTMEWVGDSGSLEQCHRVYSQHPDLTVLVRDHDGVDAASAIFGAHMIRFSPDHALGLPPIVRVPPPTQGVKVLKRADREAVVEKWNTDLFPLAATSDWTVEPRTRITVQGLAVFIVAATKLGRRSRLIERARVAAFRSIAEHLVDQGVRTLAIGKTVVTDRLHAAVLGLLIGREVLLVDNANRKLSLIFHDYLHTIPGAELCTDFREAAARTRGDDGTRIDAVHR
ncbi:polysaccharide pyruvyl transferase family protein [Smaragdicoccus niigatensis]|uniref:polysaccharide pyruvyl transferase family protein n=1 Tax=Smaragdicoccus niigatensis TaxID=359359 RepID=UPI000367803B|nr:polysaccharide pyruvyl transferase family protein [Smaragdicoccus niigatensis]